MAEMAYRPVPKYPRICQGGRTVHVRPHFRPKPVPSSPALTVGFSPSARLLTRSSGFYRVRCEEGDTTPAFHAFSALVESAVSATGSGFLKTHIIDAYLGTLSCSSMTGGGEVDEHISV